MRKFIVIFFLILCSHQSLFCDVVVQHETKKIVTTAKRINILNFPGAFNPSIVKHDQGYLLTFRYLPDRIQKPWNSCIGVVLLDESFEPISQPELLDTRANNPQLLPQSEDARLITCDGKYYIVYNDNMESTYPSVRRDMYLAELAWVNNHFVLLKPIKLVHPQYRQILWQKNWTPFEWNKTLLLSYSINPHEVVCPDLKTGNCEQYEESYKLMNWQFGPMYGGTPAQLVDGEYLAFFHSQLQTESSFSCGKKIWHYFMGAYTFSASPPFEINRMSSVPIDAPGFYTFSYYDKRVIYPGGFVVSGPNLHVAFGKDDCEIWIATIDIEELKKSMVSLK